METCLPSVLPFDSQLMIPSCAGPEFAQTLWEEKALKPEIFTRWLGTPLGTEQVLLVPPHPRMHEGLGHGRASREVTLTSWPLRPPGLASGMRPVLKFQE